MEPALGKKSVWNIPPFPFLCPSLSSRYQCELNPQFNSISCKLIQQTQYLLRASYMQAICCNAMVLNCVWLFVASWTVPCQALLPMEFSRQEYWSGLPFPNPGKFLNPGIKPESSAPPTLASRFFTTRATWEGPSYMLKMEVKSENHSVVSDSLWPYGLYSPWSSRGQNPGVGSFSLLQEIFPTQGSNPGLLHCRWVLY